MNQIEVFGRGLNYLFCDILCLFSELVGKVSQWVIPFFFLSVFFIFLANLCLSLGLNGLILIVSR